MDRAGDAWSSALDLTGQFRTPSRWAIARPYLRLGFTHILPGGLDHVLFVLGLFLLAPMWRPVLAQVTTFTLAHSITLGLALYGAVSVSRAIVEPLIALSIAYVAVENLVTTELKPWRLALVFLFGLLHGMGFAGVLQDLSLAPSELLVPPRHRHSRLARHCRGRSVLDGSAIGPWRVSAGQSRPRARSA